MAGINIDELCGWVPMPEQVNSILQAHPKPFVAQAAPHLMQGDSAWDGQSDIPLWDMCIKITGENLPAHRQTIGDCVSHGHGSGLDYLQCIQIVMGKFQGQFKVGEHECYTEAIYGNMREGKGMGNSDGAVGIWAVESLKKHGYPQRKGRTYDGQRAKQWGRTGTEQSVKAEGSDFKLADYVQVREVREAANLLFNGYPITVCSGQGFSMERDQNGICRPQGSWAHCMLCIGALMINGRLYFVILQSWGKNVPSGPTIKRMPDCSFCCEDTVFQRMLNARDSYALTSIPGFPTQKINMFI